LTEEQASKPVAPSSKWLLIGEDKVNQPDWKAYTEGCLHRNKLAVKKRIIEEQKKQEEKKKNMKKKQKKNDDTEAMSD
jgi:hypothetical protein